MIHSTLLISHTSHYLSNPKKIPSQPPSLLQAAESLLIVIAMEPSVVPHLRLLVISGSIRAAKYGGGAAASSSNGVHQVMQMVAIVVPSKHAAASEAVVVRRLPEAFQQ